ncbi:MAG: alpha/beta fold hydrolase, partial [Thermoleophilia bacterium]|nr:alpha/beta fold hydrolase [Thermoleophilia bacterium]
MSVDERTPAQVAADERDWSFGGTWPYEPRWLFTDGVRIHYVDEGPRDGEPVVLLHGNPTWAYVYRRFVGALATAGYRAIAHDQLGFGRSDKPIREKEFSVERHVRHFSALMDELELDAVTLVLQDWGGPVGLAWAVEHPHRVARLVLLNTWPGGIPKASFPLPFKLLFWPGTGALLAKGAHVFTRVFLFRGGTHPERLGENEKAAYLRPHPSWQSRSGVAAYPRLIPRSEAHTSYALGRRVEEGLDALAEKPILISWPDRDPAFGAETLEDWRRRFPDAEAHEVGDAGHYVQEDA